MGKKKKQKFNTNQNNFPGPHRQIKKAKSHYLHPSYLALQEQMRNEWIAKQTPKPTATTVVSQPNITPICVQPSAPSNFQVNRTIAVRNKEATVTGYKVPSITIAVVNTSCSNESSSASDEKKVSSSCMVDNVTGAVKDSSSCVDSNMEVFNDGISSSTGDVLEVSGVSSEQFEIGCQPENSCDDDDVIILGI